MEILGDLAIIFAVAVAVVWALGRVGLPSVVGFLLAGVVVGPSGLGLVADPHSVEVAAEVGVALLLFTIGLEFSLGRLAHIGRQVALGGGLQVALTILGAAAIAAAMGESAGSGVFWGYLAALSSTAIVLRTLADREETAAPHGRFIVAVLIFQDLCVVPMMLTLPALAGAGGDAQAMFFHLAKAAAVVAGVFVLARRVLPPLLRGVAATKHRELFLLGVLTVALGVALLTSQAGLSLALGAFLAGIAIADTDFVHDASGGVAPFRDTFASLFFVSVGMLLDPAVLWERPVEVGAVFAALVLGKTALATAAALFLGFPARVALTAGIGLAQVGEFSFVLLESGRQLGLVGEEGARVFLAASVLSMLLAPLAVAASPRLAAGAALLRPLERMLGARDLDEPEEEKPLSGHVVVAGLGAGGRLMLEALRAARVPALGIDLDPAAVREVRALGHHVRYGDVTNPEVLARVGEAGRAQLLILLLSDADAGRRAASLSRRLFPEVPVILRAHRVSRERERFDDPDVEVVAEDYETAVEIAERALRRVGLAGDAVRAAIHASRGVRHPTGAPVAPAPALIHALGIDGFLVRAGDRLAGRTLAEARIREETGALVVALSRGKELSANPPASSRMEPGDTVFLVGTAAQLARAATWVAEPLMEGV
ncbi:MAG: cation:proton antiporter [Myxococcota bacterium]